VFIGLGTIVLFVVIVVLFRTMNRRT